MDYEIGSVIEYQTWGGTTRRVLVDEKEADIKNGRPGFGGQIVDGIGAESGMGVWGYDDQITRVVQKQSEPQPYRSPLPYHTPHRVEDHNDPSVEVVVAIPNEDPATEDDLTICVKLTNEGIIIDGFVSADQEIGTFARTYEEIVGMLR